MVVLSVPYLNFASYMPDASFVLNNVDMYGPWQQFVCSEASRYAVNFLARWQELESSDRKIKIFVFRYRL